MAKMKQNEVVSRLSNISEMKYHSFKYGEDYVVSGEERKALTEAIRAYELLPELIRLAENVCDYCQSKHRAEVIEKAKELSE